ncbi:MAG: extracellular solute-binding protein, partial [Chloroflexota bacterium]|nr:extracellular solute-binding protein [Chloroflexota bacterium]
FNTSQKSLHVSFVGWGAQDYQDRVLAQLQASGIDADVITLIPNQAARLVQLGALSPIEDVIAKVGVHPSPSHNYITKDGHLYGISIVEVAFGLLYNKKLFDAAGISEPAADPDQWADQAEKLTRKPDQFGLWQPNLMSEQFSWWFFLQNFGLAYDGIWAQGQTPMLTSQPIIKALTLWRRLYGSAMAQGSNDAAAARLFADGRIAQELVVSAGVNVIKSTGPAVYPDLRSTAAPWASKKEISRLHPLSVVKTSKNQDAAKTFVEFMVQPNNMAELMIKGLDVVPPYPEVTQVPAYQDFIKSLSWSSGFLDIKPVSLLDVEGDFVFHDTEFGNVVLTNFQKALLGQTSIDQAMADAQKEAEDLASRVFSE